MKLAIVTATFNAAGSLPALVESLRRQVDPDFEWVVMDGGSRDGTQDILAAITDLPLVWHAEPDFGVYDALNKAVALSKAEFYLVMGADDVLEPDAVLRYKALLQVSGADIVTAGVRMGGNGTMMRPRAPAWLWGQLAFVTAHSVGSVYRKSLHDEPKIGPYSRRFPIAADQLFILRAVNFGARVAVGDFIAGDFGSTGMSSTDPAGMLTEFFRVQMEVEGNGKCLQVFLLVLRLVKNLPALIRQR